MQWRGCEVPHARHRAAIRPPKEESCMGRGGGCMGRGMPFHPCGWTIRARGVRSGLHDQWGLIIIGVTVQAWWELMEADDR